MEASANSLASPQGSSGSPVPKHDAQDTPDTEMTVPMTSTDDGNSTENMYSGNAFHSANQRAARMRGVSGAEGSENGRETGRETGRQGHDAGGKPAFNPHGPWRRQDPPGQPPSTTSSSSSATGAYAAGPQASSGIAPSFADPTALANPPPRPYPAQISAGNGSSDGHFRSSSGNLVALQHSAATPGIQPFPAYNPATHGPAQYPNAPNTLMNGVPADRIRPGPVYPTGGQVQTAWCYGFYRGGGNFTMLIPADELPANLGIPALQGQEGMMIVPSPRATPPNFSLQEPPMVPTSVVNALPVFNPSAPETREPGQIPPGQLQAAIDQIVASNTYSAAPGGSEKVKPEKEYCDKWVHEGVCAFTQRGCKFKHVMPLDEDTQRRLGLNNGLPAWYRKLHGNQVKFKAGANLTNASRALPSSGPTSAVGSSRGGRSARGGSERSGRTGGNWYEEKASPASPASSSGSSAKGTLVFQGRKSFGPIGPPARHPTQRPAQDGNGNPYAMLNTLDKMDEDDYSDNDNSDGGVKL